jgi:hypothetical protein
MDFLWHKVSEKEKEEIEKEVKFMIEGFSKKLSKIGQVPESSIERGEGDKEEKTECDENFSREIMFKNAPEKNKDFIISEKKKW